MKKILLIIAFCLMSVQAWAAGTCVENASDSFNGEALRWKTYTCTADSSDGTMDNTTVTGFKGYYLYTVETWPGATAPTDDSDYTLSDGDTPSKDLMDSNGVDGIDQTTKEIHIPSVYYMVKGNLVLAISNNAVHSAIIYVRITGVK